MTKNASDAYKQAGVDIDAGNAFVDRIKPLIKKTRRPGVLSDVGMFAGFFAVDRDKYKNPVLVAGCDGVGTKILLAEQLQKFDTIGIDLVGMCVNDVLVHGAEPLFFLDYLACGALDSVDLYAIVEGIAEGCEQARCALLGGETAEMPGVYESDKFDLSGFAVGAVERDSIIDGSGVRVGSSVIGIASSGLHSNGYSLARKLVNDHNIDLKATWEGSDRTVGELLLAPTSIYVRPVMHVIEQVEVLSAAHITGGGLIENLPRMLPRTARAEIDFDSWTKPAIFGILQQAGNLPNTEMLRVFNCGIGFVLVVAAGSEKRAIEILEEQGSRAWVIGAIEAREEGRHGLTVRRGDETIF